MKMNLIMKVIMNMNMEMKCGRIPCHPFRDQLTIEG